MTTTTGNLTLDKVITLHPMMQVLVHHFLCERLCRLETRRKAPRVNEDLTLGQFYADEALEDDIGATQQAGSVLFHILESHGDDPRLLTGPALDWAEDHVDGKETTLKLAKSWALNAAFDASPIPF